MPTEGVIRPWEANPYSTDKLVGDADIQCEAFHNNR